MITFTETDFNLKKVKQESKLFNLITRYKYHVYGLRQDGNPSILIEYHPHLERTNFKKKLDSLVEFFKINGIIVEVFNKSENRTIDIGMRKDLRTVETSNGKPILAASILQTIVYALENRIDIEEMQKYRVPSIPSFPSKS